MKFELAPSQSDSTYHAIVRPCKLNWNEGPASLHFSIRPPLDIADPEGIGDAIHNELDATTGLIAMTPIIGNSNEGVTYGRIVMGSRRDIGTRPIKTFGDKALNVFGDITIDQLNRAAENESIAYALSSLIGHLSINVVISEIPIGDEGVTIQQD